MALNVRKGADSLIRIMTELGVEVNAKTGGEIIKSTAGLTYTKVSDSSYLMMDSSERVVLHNSTIFLNTLNELERHLKVNFFG